MKFSVLALDFDGTIARDDTLDDDVREAIATLRTMGIVVAIVTGRILEDLRRVTGGLHLVDAVVAENGAVVEFPSSGYTMRNGIPPPSRFSEALIQAGIAFDAGQVVIEADAGEAHGILTIIRRLELPLTIAFNRGRLMVLPQTVSKATGLRKALAILRLSPRNTVGIGDAENDHELLQTCEFGVAVGWGSEALKASADYVLPGDGPHAVAEYVRALAASRLIPSHPRTRRRLLLGHTAAGESLELAVRGRNVLVSGDPKSGKSWITGLLCEQLILHGYSLCVLDPEGDYASLEALPGVTVLGGADPLPRTGDIVRALRHADTSVIIDLSRTPHDLKVDYMRNLLPALAALRRHTGLPHRIVVDEAHYFLHDSAASQLLDLELNSYTLVSSRASKLHPDALSAIRAIVVACESDPHEVRTLLALCPSCAESRSPAQWEEVLGHLAVGEAAVLPVTDEADGRIKRITLVPRLTPHVRHRAKYIDVPVLDAHAFVLWHNGAPTGRRLRTLREFVAVLEDSSTGSVRGHLQRSDFSRWISSVFGDYPLAEIVGRFESEYRQGALLDPLESMANAIRSRYEFIAPETEPPRPES